MHQLTYEVRNAKEGLVYTSNDLTLAQRFVDRMAQLGSSFHILKVRPQRKAA